MLIQPTVQCGLYIFPQVKDVHKCLDLLPFVATLCEFADFLLLRVDLNQQSAWISVRTGISAECQQTRSQLQNRDTAMRMLKARLYQSKMGKEREQRHTARKQQVTGQMHETNSLLQRTGL